MLKQLQQALIPPRLIAKVNTVNADGTVTVTTDSGFTYNAIGTGTVNTYVYTQNGMVIGSAPSLPFASIDV